jgi:hypothetical protein
VRPPTPFASIRSASLATLVAAVGGVALSACAARCGPCRPAPGAAHAPAPTPAPVPETLPFVCAIILLEPDDPRAKDARPGWVAPAPGTAPAR